MSRATRYALGHGEDELARLQRQHRFIEPSTRRFFLEAGLGPGMRVLDVGSGAGDVAFLAAEIVGREGSVIGCDRVPAAVQAANDRARSLGLDQVSFLDGDPAAIALPAPVDAVVGRYVLLFQSEPAALLGSSLRHLRPGGLVVFHEPTWDSVGSSPVAPSYDRSRSWIQAAFSVSGTPDTGFAPVVYRAFVDAGVARPTVRLETLVTGGPVAAEWVQSVADLVISLRAVIEQHGIASADEIDAPTLARRMLDEVIAAGSVLIGRTEIGAWGRI